MKNVLLMIRNGAFAVAIAVALCFGAAEALSGSPDPTWRPPECTLPDYCEEDWECYDICWKVQLPYGGTCDHNCCVCFE